VYDGKAPAPDSREAREKEGDSFFWVFVGVFGCVGLRGVRGVDRVGENGGERSRGYRLCLCAGVVGV